jgi:hypothetical protein
MDLLAESALGARIKRLVAQIVQNELPMPPAVASS